MLYIQTFDNSSEKNTEIKNKTIYTQYSIIISVL